MVLLLTWPDVLIWLPWLLACADQFQKGDSDLLVHVNENFLYVTLRTIKLEHSK